jgi:Malic enzyme, NAD binding domain
MMRSPTAAYSIRLRVRLDNRPGSLGRLATAIGDAGGNITALGGFDVRGPHLEEDLVVNCRDEGHIGRIRSAVDGLEGCEVLELADRTFLMHDGGKIEVLARMPVAGRGDLNAAKLWFAENTNPERRDGTLSEVLPGADVFIGVSGPGLLGAAELRAMAPDPIVFVRANPDPEITPEDAEGLAGVIATGRSDYPNQINNVLAFPGIFRGALDVAATAITEGMKLAAAKAIAGCVAEDELKPDHIVPSVFDPRVAPEVAAAVAEAAIDEGVVRVHRPPQV